MELERCSVLNEHTRPHRLKVLHFNDTDEAGS